MIRPLAFSIAAFLLAACATAPKPDVQPAPQPAPVATTSATATPPTPASTAFDPVGAYTFAVDMQGQSIGGSMNIRKGTDGRLGGEMTSDQGSLTFSSVTLEGKKVTAVGTLDNGPEIVFVFDFVGDDFTGSLSAQGNTVGSISGTRKKN